MRHSVGSSKLTPLLHYHLVPLRSETLIHHEFSKLDLSTVSHCLEVASDEVVLAKTSSPRDFPPFPYWDTKNEGARAQHRDVVSAQICNSQG